MSVTYDGINVPQYGSIDEELDELMNYYKFAYKKDSGYNGTCMFEILDDNNEMTVRSVRCDNESGNVTVWKSAPPDGNVSCCVTLPFSTFHDVFWGIVGCQALVMGGGATVHNWRYKEALAFGRAFDMSTQNWKKYYAYLDCRKCETETENENENNDSNVNKNETESARLNLTCIFDEIMFDKQFASIDHLNNLNKLAETITYQNNYNNGQSKSNKIEKKEEIIKQDRIENGMNEFGKQYKIKLHQHWDKIKNNEKMQFMVQSQLSQFMQHCYSYISGFNLEDNYLCVTKTTTNQSSNYYSSYDQESTRMLSQIKWKNDRNNNNNDSFGYNYQGNSVFSRNENEAICQAMPARGIIFGGQRYNGNKLTEKMDLKMDMLMDKSKTLRIISQSMEKIYNYGNDKGNIMLDSMLS